MNEEYVIINRNPVDHFWFPDIYISKAKELRKPFYKIPPSYLRVHESGKMVYSARVNFDLSCPMDFGKYPVNIQQFFSNGKVNYPLNVVRMTIIYVYSDHIHIG